jgi:hypothetical protein
MAARDVEALNIADSTDLISQVVEVRRMIYGLLKRLENDEP